MDNAIFCPEPPWNWRQCHLGSKIYQFCSWDIAQIVYKIWARQYLGGHLGIKVSATWGLEFIDFVLGTQWVFVANLKSVAQIVSKIQWKMHYFGSHLGIEGSVTCGPILRNFVLGTQWVFVPNFKSVGKIVSEIWTINHDFGSHLGIEGSSTWCPKT